VTGSRGGALRLGDPPFALVAAAATEHVACQRVGASKSRATSARMTIAAAAAAVLGVECCAGPPLAVAGIGAAAFGGLIVGGTAAAVLLIALGGFTLNRRQRQTGRPSPPKGPVP